MNKFEWIFRVFDKASAPARAIDNALGKLQDRFKGAGTAAGGFMKHLQDLFFLKEAIGLVGELGAKLHELGAEVLRGMAFKQNSLIALEALRGTRSAAIEAFEDVEDFAWKTGQSVASVMAVTKDLLTAGFDSREVRYLSQLLGDLAIIDPGKAQAAQGLIADVNRLGEMSGRQLHMMKGIIPLEEFRKELSLLLRFPVTLDQIEKRGVRAADAVTAFSNAMLRIFSGGVAGSLQGKVMNTLPGLLKQMAAIPEYIVDELAGYTRGAGGGAFEAILRNINNAFDPKGPSGIRIVNSLRNLLAEIGDAFGVTGGPNGLLSELSGPNGVQAVERVFASMTSKVSDAVPVVRDVASALWDVVKAIDWMIKKSRDAGGWVRDLLGMDQERLADSMPTFQAAAEARKKGLGLMDTFDYVSRRQAEAKAGTTNHNTIEATFNIHGVSAADGDKLQMSITEAIADAFERLAYQRGVAPYPVR